MVHRAHRWGRADGRFGGVWVDLSSGTFQADGIGIVSAKMDIIPGAVMDAGCWIRSTPMLTFF